MFPPLRAISLDFANTLYPFRAAETDESIRRLHDFLRGRLHHRLDYAPFEALYKDIRARQFTENRPTLQENDFTARIREVVEFCQEGAPAGPDFVQEAETVYADAFVSVIRPPIGLKDTVALLSEHYTLAVLSNFPRTDCIRRPLERDGLLPYLQGVVVSADVGFVKPHEAMFAALCDALALPPQQIVHVGDDWDADVLGAGAAGMPCVYTHEWRDEPDPFFGQDETPPLFEITHLAELLPRLQVWERSR